MRKYLPFAILAAIAVILAIVLPLTLTSSRSDAKATHARNGDSGHSTVSAASISRLKDSLLARCSGGPSDYEEECESAIQDGFSRISGDQIYKDLGAIALEKSQENGCEKAFEKKACSAAALRSAEGEIRTVFLKKYREES